MDRLVALAPFLVLLSLACGDSAGDSIEASGAIEGTDVRIGSEVGGRILSIRTDEGLPVFKGDTLVVLDESDYRLQFKQASAGAEAADAQFRLAAEGAREEDIIQAEAVYRAAETDYERAIKLLASQTITQKQFDDTRTRYVSAQQTFEKLSGGLRKDEVTAARANRDQAFAYRDLVAKRLSDCILIAPSSGIVTLKSVEEGELVTPGGNLLRITRLDTVKLAIYVPEEDLASVRLGQEAEVTIDGAGERTFRGSVVSISDVAEFTPKNVQTKEERTKLVFAVKIRIPNPDGTLKPGMSADARLTRVGNGGE